MPTQFNFYSRIEAGFHNPVPQTIYSAEVECSHEAEKPASKQNQHKRPLGYQPIHRITQRKELDHLG